MDSIKEKNSGFTLRAFITGAIFCFFVAIACQYSVNIVHGSYLAIDHMPAGGIFIFFIFTLLINTILKKMGIGFSSSEQLLIYVMLIISSSVVTMGLGSQILPMLAAPFYYATPENRWAEILQPYIKPWLVPHGAENIRTFFEGLPKGTSIPWGTWLKPLAAWLPFILALYLVMICIMVILRKQWVEKERLIFPLVRLPLEIVKEEKGKSSAFAPFYKNKLMWFGFGIPFLIGSLNALHHYFHFIPMINLVQSIPIFRQTTSIVFRLSFPVLGLAYLVNLDVAFSLWFFNLLSTALKGMFNITGVSSPENVGIYGCGGDPIFAHLGTGAFLVLVLFGLWMARAHLRDVFRKAFKGDKKIDDSEEMLSYRAAVIGLILGSIFMLGWLIASGISFWYSLFFLLGALLFFLGLTRVVAEGGIPTLVAPSISSAAVVSAAGSSNVGTSGLVGLGFTYVYSSDVRTFPMCPAAHGLKMSEEIGKKKRLLFWGMFLALIIGIFTSLWLNLRLSYTYGGANLNSWYFVGGPKAPFEYTADKILHPSSPNGLGWLSKGIGAIVMFGLMFMRNRFLWWPLHPIGFAVGSVWLMSSLWFSIFLAWLLKRMILRYGGPKIYKNSIPFFLGLILGQYTCAGVWFVIDYFTKMTGNQVFWI